jgi:hypothetical protein
VRQGHKFERRKETNKQTEINANLSCSATHKLDAQVGAGRHQPAPAGDAALHHVLVEHLHLNRRKQRMGKESELGGKKARKQKENRFTSFTITNPLYTPDATRSR